MSLAALASVAGFLSSIAVVLSLFYLGSQIRQAAHPQRASMQQGRSARTVDLLLRTAEPEMARAILRGRRADPDIEPGELEQFLRASTAMFISFEDGYVLRTSGILNPTTVAGDDAALANHILPWPGHRIAWEMLKAAMQPDFRAYVDDMIVKTPIRSTSDRLETWKRLAARPVE